MSRSQAHVLLQHQHQQTTLSREYNTMLPRLSELDISLGANGGSGLSSPLRLNGDGIHAHPPRGGHVDNVPQVPPPPNPISPSSHKPWYDHPSVTSRESSRWQPNTGTIGRSTGGFQPQQPAQQQQQQQPQQQQQRKIQQYQSVIGGMQQTSQISSSSPANQYSSPMQVQHPVTVEWWNNEPDPPWSPVSTRNQVPGPHHRNSVEGSHAHKSSLDSGIPISPRRKESGPVALRPGDVIHHNHGENVRQISARLVCIPEYHERSASCPALHPATSFLQRPGDTPTFPRNTTTSNMRSENHYASGPFHDQSMGKAQGSSPETPRMLQNGVRKNMDDKHMHVSMQGTRSEVRTGHTNDMVLGWMSSPRSEPKITASNTLDATTTPTATPTSHHDSQETRHSNKFMGDLTSPSGITWEKNPGEPSFRPYAVNYYPNNNVNNPETTGASGGSMNETGHGDSNAMEEYESDRHPSQTQRASMASSTTSSETTNARMSDSGSVTKRRSISAPKREYRCTKKDGCDAVFSCNSLRKKHEMKHTKPFICSQRSCPKHKVGFTTSNDLRRHMKALHGFRYKSSVASPSSRGMSGVPGGDGSVDGGDTAEAVPPADAVGGWRCKYCAQMEAPNPIGHANPSKGFFSTRKDNFRNHIKRIHSGLRREKETMDDFFRRSEVECRVDSPVLLPTVPSPETPLVMDTDMDSPEVGSARGFGGRRHGMGEQSGNFGLRGREERERLPSVEEWQGLPPPASNTRAVTHGHTRSDILPPQDTISTEVAGKGDYHSTLDRRQADRNANCGQQHQIQQNDQARGMMSGQHHQLQRSNRENADRLEKRGGDYLSLGRNNNSQVERFTGPEHPTGSSRLTSMSSNGWTSVNTSSYNHRAAAHTDGSRTEGYNFATHTHESSAVRDAGARSEEISMPHAHLHIVGAEELRRLDQEEENMLRELERIRAQRKKLLEQLSQSRSLSSSQPTPVRRTHIAESDQDVEMVDCEASHPSSKCSAQAEKQIPSASGPGRTSVSVSQLLNAEDGSPSGPIGKTTSPSITPGNMNAVQEASAMVHENLFLPPKSASPPPPRWQFPPVAGVTGSPRGKSTAASNTSNALRGSTEVAPFRRPQSWYNNRIKPGTVPSKDNNKEYKAFCPHCQSSFRLPCQLRKHLKRHSKPFGCTHDGCNKVFGAKNDWKRHENSQHHQLECWKCDIRCLTATAGAASDTPDICGKCFFRKADFVKHLKMVHGNADGWAVTSANQAGGATTGDQLPTTITHTGNRDLGQIISDCHIPKFHGGAFWCGFCHRVIKLHGKVGIEGWDKRFDHIAWHFEKDNLRVKDTWMRLEEPSPEDDGKGPGASSAKGVDDSSDEDDGDVDLNDSSPRRRQTEPTPLPSYARQSQLKGTEGAPGRGKETSEKWYCCKCEYGPFLTALYVDCPHCTRHHRCDNCKEQIVTKPCK